MNPEELKDYNALVDIINLQQDMFEQLDKYRGRTNKDDKTHLFAAHSFETEIRKRINHEADKHPSPNQNIKAA